MIKKPDAKICLQCHTPQHDDGFDYRLRLSQLDCG